MREYRDGDWVHTRQGRGPVAEPLDAAVGELLAALYGRDSAGLDIPPEILLPSLPEDAEAVFYIYCVGGTGRLKGIVPPLRLLTAAPETPVRSLLQHDLLTVHIADDQEVVKNKFEKYDVVALPVVDDGGQMLGVITHDDVLEVAEDEAEEDMLYMAGTQPEEFATASPFHAASIRARWLLPCLAGTLVRITVMFPAEPTLGALFLFRIPFNSPIAAMGGNAGVQTSTPLVPAPAAGAASAASVRRAVPRAGRRCARDAHPPVRRRPVGGAIRAL